MRTRLPTNTFWPSEQLRPMTAPPHTCTQCQMRVPSPICAPSSMMADSCTCMSVVQRKRDAHAVSCRPVDCRQQRQGMQALAAVGFRLGFAAQGADDVVVVQGVAETIDRGGLVAGVANLGVIGVFVGEFPVLDLV